MKRVVVASLLGALTCTLACSGKSSAPKKESKAAPKAQEPPSKESDVKNDQAPPSKGPADDKGDADGKTADKNLPPTGRSFKQGDRALSGVTVSELPFYNKAQGDPIEGAFTMDKACEGTPELCDASKGKLFVTFKTTMGSFRCELFDTKAPLSVANFMGLGRGVRPFQDPKTQEWTKAPFYDGVVFHRVIDGFMIQTGDRTGSGRGGPGYFIADEFHKELRHDGPGYLSMANRNRIDPSTGTHMKDKKTNEALANTGSSQFFVTVAPTRHLDDRHAIFGKCDPKVPVKISKVRVQNRPPFADHRPFDPIKIESLVFERKKK